LLIKLRNVKVVFFIKVTDDDDDEKVTGCLLTVG